MTEVNYNVKTGITEGGITLVQPKQAKGGVFAPADIALIKEALSVYAQGDVEDAKQRQVVNLMHRLNSRM
jgi:hypothetical protein